MEAKTFKKCETVMFCCLFVLVQNCVAANVEAITTVTPKLPATNNSRLILDTANLDLNKDGCISGKEELDGFKQQVSEALEGVPNSVLRAHSIVHRTDVNRDGKICWCDFISIFLLDKVFKSKHSVPFSVIPDDVMFLQLDEDGDGQLAGGERDKLLKEFESCLPHSRAQSIVSSLAGLLDTDASISHREYQEYFNTPRETSHQNSSAVDKGNNPL